MKIYIHNQCAGPGIAGTQYLGNRNGDMPEDDCDDYLVYEGTESELIAEADSAEAVSKMCGAGTNVFWRRVARSIREAIQ